MKNFGNPYAEFRGIPLSSYKKNLKGIATDEMQSTYTVRKEDGKVFYSNTPTMENRIIPQEEWAPIDDTRYGKDQEAEAVRGQAVRSQMYDTYRRSEARRGGGRSDYLQLSEEMVSKDEEDQILRHLYTRLPDRKDIEKRQAIRQMGKCEVYNDFDFEHLENGGQARSIRNAAYALDDARRIQDKKRMDRIKTEFEGNAQDYYSRQDLNMRNDIRNENRDFDKVWKADQIYSEARADFTEKSDPIRIELIQNLSAAQLLSADGTTFVPAKLIEKVNERGATYAELTDLAEVLTTYFGKGCLNKECSVREFVEIVGRAAELAASDAPRHILSQDERSMWDEVFILAKTSQILLKHQSPPKAMPSISRISEKYIKREGYLTSQLENGNINRAQYNAKMYEMMTKFHDSLLEISSRSIKQMPNDNAIRLLENAARIFELWSANVRNNGANGLSYREVDAMKDIIAFNSEILEEAGFPKSSIKNQQVPIELLIKAYASQLENVMRYSPSFDKQYPGVRAKYKHAYTKVSEELDRYIFKSAPKAIREQVEVLGARYTEILENPRISKEDKAAMLNAIDMSISKADAMLSSSKRVVDPRTAYEMRNTADSLAKLEGEITETINRRVDPRKYEKESFIGKPATLAYENWQGKGRKEINPDSYGRGELNYKVMNNEIDAGGMRAVSQTKSNRIGHSVVGDTINELRISDGVKGRSTAFTPGSIADEIANAGYSSAYGGASDFPTEISYNHKW